MEDEVCPCGVDLIGLSSGIRRYFIPDSRRLTSAQSGTGVLVICNSSVASISPAHSSLRCTFSPDHLCSSSVKKND